VKIYQFTILDKLGYSIQWIREYAWGIANQDLNLYHYGTPKHVRELRKLRRKVKNGGIKYTIAVYGKSSTYI
jgi:hypothetical protein